MKGEEVRGFHGLTDADVSGVEKLAYLSLETAYNTKGLEAIVLLPYNFDLLMKMS